jgi:hypothetical protein
VRACDQEALYPTAKHQQHQWRDAEQQKTHEKLAPHFRVSNPASSRSETSLAGSFPHAPFEIIVHDSDRSAAHEGATDEQDARSTAKWRAGKLEQLVALRAGPVCAGVDSDVTSAFRRIVRGAGRVDRRAFLTHE